MKNLKILLSYLLVFSLTAGSFSVKAQSSQGFGFDQQVDQWLASPPSLELSQALKKLEELLQTPEEKQKEDSILPEALAGLLGGDNFDMSEAQRQDEILHNSDTGLILIAERLNISDYNKLILVASMIYREYPEVRGSLNAWFNEMQGKYAQHLGHEPSAGTMVADTAVTFVTVLLVIRTGLAFGRSGFVRQAGNMANGAYQKVAQSSFVQGIYSKFARTRSTGLPVVSKGVPLTPPPTPNLPAAVQARNTLPIVAPSNAMRRIREFLRSNKEMLSISAASAVIAGGNTALQNHLYHLQTERISPALSLQMMQADLACELAHVSVELRKDIESTNLSGADDWTQLTAWSQALRESIALNNSLVNVFPALTDLWIDEARSWPGLREQLESQLNTSANNFSCTRVKSDVIVTDLRGAQTAMHNHFLNSLLLMDPQQAPSVAANHRSLFEMNYTWLNYQDDLIDSNLWLKNLLAEIGAQIQAAEVIAEIVAAGGNL